MPDPIRVLFGSEQSSARSRIAAAFAVQLGEGRIEAYSARSAPAKEVDPVVVAVMREVGTDVSHSFPKPLTDEMLRAADAVVALGCGHACPLYPRKRYEDWAIEDPVGPGARGGPRRARGDPGPRRPPPTWPAKSLATLLLLVDMSQNLWSLT